MGKPVVILPLAITKSMGARVLRFLGDPLIQYGDVLALPDARDDDIAAAFRAALNADVGAVALLRRVRDDARAAAYLRAHATSMCMQQTALVDLTEASTLSARNRRELRRLRRRLEEFGPVDIRFPTGEDAEAVLLHALALKRAWMKEHGLASAVIGNSDWEPALMDMFGAGVLRVAALTVGGRLAAAELALCDESCWYAFLGAFDPHFARMGPGHVLTDACLSRGRSEGFVCYDQLPPLQAYKREQATHILDVRDYAISFSAQGRVIAAAAGLIPEFKGAFANLPPELRRSILTLLRH